VTKDNLLQFTPGDIVTFNGVALLYQASYSVGELKENNLGMIIKSVPFYLQTNKDDCQDISDGSIIQEPEIVYTVLSHGFLLEVLDIDIRCLI